MRHEFESLFSIMIAQVWFGLGNSLILIWDLWIPTNFKKRNDTFLWLFLSILIYAKKNNTALIKLISLIKIANALKVSTEGVVTFRFHNFSRKLGNIRKNLIINFIIQTNQIETFQFVSLGDEKSQP